MLRGGILGFGRMGMTHYSILNTRPDVEFVAVCDSSRMVRSWLKRYTSLELFEDYSKMLGNVDMDFVIVSTPPASHTEIGIAAAEAQLHLFVEKPFALHEREGRQLVEAVQARRLVNQVGYFLRFNNVFKAVRELLNAGCIGKAVHYKNEMYGRAVLKPSRDSWRGRKRMGGGCLVDFGSHCIDLADYLFGPVRSVWGSAVRSVYSTDVEDVACTTLEHENGLSGTVLVNWSDASYRRPFNRIEIWGTDGKIVADRQEYRVYLRKTDDAAEFRKGWNVRYLPDLDHGVRFVVRGPEFTEQLDHFVECIQQKRTATTCTFSDALRTDTIMEKILQDSVRGRV